VSVMFPMLVPVTKPLAASRVTVRAPAEVSKPNLAQLGGFCREMGSQARQGEVGLVVGDEYFAIRDFAEE